MERMDNDYYCDSNNPNKKKTIGVILIGVGILFLFRNFNFFPYYIENLVFSWQMLLVAIGVVLLSNGRKRTPGLVLVGVGGFFLIPEVFPFDFNFRNLFVPAILLALGFMYITHKPKRKKKVKYESSDVDMDFLDELAIFGGIEKNVTSLNFKGGKITALFGGCEINMLNSDLEVGPVVLEVTAVFGGVNLIVPADWNVKIELTPILGGFSDARRRMPSDEIDYSKELIIKGTVIFGGGELKSY